MNAKEKTRNESLARVVKSLAHPARLFLVAALEKGEKNVGDLTKLVGADVSTVSKHLSLLRSAGVLDHRKAGLQVFYRRRTPVVAKFFECVEEIAAGIGRTKRPAEPAKPAAKPAAKAQGKRAAKTPAKTAAKKPAGRRR